jgi:hypothetical protein
MLEAWTEARDHMKSALKLLDESNAPLELGAQLDSTICRLEQAIEAHSKPTSRDRTRASSNHS